MTDFARALPVSAEEMLSLTYKRAIMRETRAVDTARSGCSTSARVFQHLEFHYD